MCKFSVVQEAQRGRVGMSVCGGGGLGVHNLGAGSGCLAGWVEGLHYLWVLRGKDSETRKLLNMMRAELP